ncbi:hypothetical protein NHQ30_000663 [Ciborinia camelliae]|nr:hypothetical protein NHQ30_000663 [Ciborinia camelliae]
MSFILRQSIRAARPVSFTAPTRRTFAVSSVRTLKESDRLPLPTSPTYPVFFTHLAYSILKSLLSKKDELLTGKCKIDNPEQAVENERHKQDQLAKQKEGKNHWKPELASDSEEAVEIPATRPRFAKHRVKKEKRLCVDDPIQMEVNAQHKYYPVYSEENQAERVKWSPKDMLERSKERAENNKIKFLAKKKGDLRGKGGNGGVAADRHEHSDHSEEGIKKLQKKTAGHAAAKHK